MPSIVCAHCKLGLGGEPFIKLNDVTYHRRCWDHLNAAMKNKRDPTGRIVCPTCQEPVRIGDGTAFREGYAVHLACSSDPA